MNLHLKHTVTIPDNVTAITASVQEKNLKHFTETLKKGQKFCQKPSWKQDKNPIYGIKLKPSEYVTVKCL